MHKNFILDLIFTVLLISLLIFVRTESKSYFQQVQGFSEDIAHIENGLSSNEFTEQDTLNADQTLTSLNKILTKSIFLNVLLLPLVIFLLWVVFQGLIWRSLTKMSLSKFALISIIPVVLFFSLILYFLEYVSFVFFKDTTASLVVLILMVLLLFIVNYFYLILVLKPNLKMKEIFKIAKTKFSKLIVPYLILSLTAFIYLILGVLIFIFSYVGTSFIIPALLLALLLILLQYERKWLLKLAF